MRILAGLALKPHVDYHAKDFKEVIDFGASKNGALSRGSECARPGR
jgi:hypothetical protein